MTLSTLDTATAAQLQHLHDDVVAATRIWQAATYGTPTKARAWRAYRAAETVFVNYLLGLTQPLLEDAFSAAFNDSAFSVSETP